MRTTIFQGLPIVIENEAGSTRSGVSPEGKPWSVVLPYAYGYVKGTHHIDGDEIDVFIGPENNAKWVYNITQVKSNGTFDENKFFMGFKDAMDAKAAFYKSYTDGAAFYGDLSTISLEDFKKKCVQSKKNPALIRASEGFSIGDPVTVDGFHGRGVIIGIKGRRLTIRFWNREYVSRDQLYVHKMTEGNYKSKYSSLNAGGPGSGRHKENWKITKDKFGNSRHVLHTNKGTIKLTLNSLATKSSAVATGILHDLYVSKYNRGKGYGTELVNQALTYAKSLGHTKILINPDNTNIARRFWKDKFEINPKGGIIHSSIENEGIPEEQARGQRKYIVQEGTQYCIRTNGVDKNFGCWPSREKAEAVMAGKSFIEPDLPKNLLAKSDCEWITEKGQHICIKPGQTKSEAIKQHFAKFKDKSTNKQAKVKVGSITKGSKGSLTTNTKLDPKDLKKVGVKITDEPNSKYDDFHSNFRLHDWRGEDTIDNTGKALQMFHDKFGMSPKEMEDVLLSGLPKSMQSGTRMEISPLDTKGNKWFVLLNNGTMRMERSFDFSKGTVEHTLWEVKSKEQGQGIGKQVFSNQLDLYDHLGLNSVHTHANIDVGGYAWARYGFVPDKSSWSGVRQDIKTKMEVVEGKGSKDEAYDNSYNIHPEQWSALKSQVSNMTSDDKQQINKILSIKDPSAIKLIASFHSSNGDPVGKSLLLGSDWEGSLNLNSKSSYASARAYSSTKPSKIRAAQAGPFVNEHGVKTDSALHEPLLSSEFGNNVADAVAYKIAIKNGWGPADALKYFVKSPKLKNRILKRDRDRVLAGKVIRQSPAEFRKSECRAGIKPYVDAGGPGSGRKPTIAKGLNQWKSPEQERKAAAKDPKQQKLPLKAFGIKFKMPSPFKVPTQTGTKPAPSSMNHVGNVGHKKPNAPMKNGKGSGHRFSNPAFMTAGGIGSGRHKEMSVAFGDKILPKTLELLRDKGFHQDSSNRYEQPGPNIHEDTKNYSHPDGHEATLTNAVGHNYLHLFSDSSNFMSGIKSEIKQRGIQAGGPGSGRRSDEQDGEYPVARYGEKKPAPWEDIKSSKKKKKIEANDWGEPNAGAYQHAHLDTNLWFHPPSLKNPDHVPTDDPQEKDNKWLDVTKRNSKDTKDMRNKLLKRSTPGGTPPSVPVRTTLISPTLNAYLPMSAAASHSGRRRRRSGGRSFRAFGAASI